MKQNESCKPWTKQKKNQNQKSKSKSKEPPVIQISNNPLIFPQFTFSGFSLQTQFVELVTIVDSSCKLAQRFFNKYLDRCHSMETVELGLPPFYARDDLRGFVSFSEIDEIMSVSIICSIVDECQGWQVTPYDCCCQITTIKKPSKAYRWKGYRVDCNAVKLPNSCWSSCRGSW